MSKILFLDRDGVINADRQDYTWKISDFIFLPGVFEACLHWQKAGFKIIVVTNQGGVAKGLYRHNDVNVLHNHMNDAFMSAGVNITDVYYCPHHPDSGLCLCRKPGSLLVEKALAVHNGNPEESWFIGDRERDIVAANGAGVKGVLIPENGNLMTIYSNQVW
ncbi:MAG TPA: HAD family hydrolase [Bacteroidia bacterium]|nr:HAD family hydrolase [Bacteroidia bacterium]